MEAEHFRKVDAWFPRHFRRAIGVKHSYYSHIQNKEVWLRASKPILPSQSALATQFRLLLQSLNADPADPFHHVSFGPAPKDRVSLHKHHKTEPLPPHWLSLTYSHAMEFIYKYIPQTRAIVRTLLVYSNTFRYIARPFLHDYYRRPRAIHIITSCTVPASVAYGSRKNLYYCGIIGRIT